MATLSFALPHTAKHIAVALSGGPDSWALCLLADEWCKTNRATLVALTVDHKLRADSTAEAENVAAECARRGIAHHILTWQHNGVSSSVQEQARDARYSLLTEYCRAHGIPLLLTAHHADDQSETVLLRFAKASDVGGLAGLQPLHNLHGVTVGRPLLAYTKQQLIDYVKAAGISFVADPSNENNRFARARLRDARSVLEAEGLTTANLVRLADKMRAADEALDFATTQFISNQFVVSPYGTVSAPVAALHDKPAALVTRALLLMWRIVTGDTGHPIGHDQLQRLLQFAQQSAEQKITMAGMVLEHGGDSLLASRELAACASPITVAAHASAVWDNRFAIHNGTAAAVTVGALTDFGRDKIAGLDKAFHWLHAPAAAARACLPAEYRPQPIPVQLDAAASGTVTAMFLTAKSTKTALYSA